MPPSCVAQKSKNKDAQRAHRSISEVDEESHTEHSEPTDEGGEDDSVPSQGNAVQRMIIDSVSKQKKRHLIDKKKIRKGYSDAKSDIQTKINAFFDKHENESDAAHHARLDRLAELLATKAAIESQMTTKLEDLRAQYDTHARELSFVVGLRIKDLK